MNNQNASLPYYDTSNNNTFSALQIRLDTKPIIDEIELFLTGKKLIIEDTGQGLKANYITTGKARANAVGCQNVLNFITSIFNSQIVQGNFTNEQYDYYIYEVNISLIKNIVINQMDWEISDGDIETILDFIMNMVIPFVSRLIENKERESYIQTIKSIENNTMQTYDQGSKNQGLKIF